MQTPQVLDGRYRLQDRLGSGGMSVVWRAHDRVLNRAVAIKVLDGEYAVGTAARERIRAEAQAAAGIWHPNVTNVFDYGEATGKGGDIVPYVVMELMPGRTLAQRLVKGPLPSQTALRICAEVASGLAAAHAIGLVHRDVKPANVMLTPSGAKVFDFGIAALIGGPEVEFDGHMMGTPAYLAPERLTENIVIPESDVYALGLLIYRALTNELPWDAQTSTQMLTAHIYLEPAPLPAIDGVADAVNEVCARCLAKDPAVRPSAGEVAAIVAAAAGMVSFPWDDAPEPPIRAVTPSGDSLPRRVPRPIAVPDAEEFAGPTNVPARESGLRGIVPPPSGAPRRPGSPMLPVRRRAAVALLRGIVAVILIVAAITLVRHGSQAGNAADPVRSPGSGPAALPSPSKGATGPTASSSGPGPTPSASGIGGAAPSTGRAAVPGVPSTPTLTPTPAPTATSTPTSTPSSPAPTAGPTTPSGTLASADGGTIRFSCTGNSARILTAAPAPGWTTGSYNPGPSVNVRVGFAMPPRNSEIDVHCNHGAATIKIKETPSGKG